MPGLHKSLVLVLIVRPSFAAIIQETHNDSGQASVPQERILARGSQPEFKKSVFPQSHGSMAAPSLLEVSSKSKQYPGSFPGMSPYASGTRALTASMGLPPYGMDCCPCLANEEDYRVYPVSPGFLELEQLTPGSVATPPAFLQTSQPPGAYAGIVDPGGIQGRMAMATQGLPPYGMDCCPCLANEEDYRVYPPDL